MRDSLQAQVVKVRQRLAGPLDIEPLSRTEFAEDCGDFQVDEFGCHKKTLRGNTVSCPSPRITIVTENVDENARVENYQLESRSERTARAAALNPTFPPVRCPIRSNNSSSVGR